MRAAGVLIAIALALALQTSLARFLVGGTAALDLVLVVVVYVALTSGPVTGMLAGSAAGIVQDALSSGTVGIGGLAKAIVGFAAGVEACSERTLFFLGPRSGCLLLPLPLDDDIAVLATREGEPVILIRAEVAGDRIRTLHAVLLPA